MNGNESDNSSGNIFDDGVDVVTGDRMFLDRDQWKKCGRRVPRAELEHAVHAVWMMLPHHTHDMFSIRTIGELGAYCVLSDEVLREIAPDHMLDIVLFIEDERYEFEARVRYLHKDGIAIEFIRPPREAREKIRTLFRPEFLATSLSPFLSYTTMEPGSTATLIYSDGAENRLQIALVSEKILAVFMDLEILNTHLVWRKSGTKKTGEFTSGAIHPDHQKKILNFVKNLPGLSSDFLKEIESIFTFGRIS
jgi:hypothetical protein